MRSIFTLMNLHFTGDLHLVNITDLIMGLCKCPKRKVTNQFCFEHRVNVCEYCMVSSHSTCPVQSYLQWLQDSDYNPNCFFCESKYQRTSSFKHCSLMIVLVISYSYFTGKW